MWTSNLVAFLAGISLFGSAAALPQLLQTPRGTGYGVGADLDTVGLLMMPIALAAFLASLCTRYLHGLLLVQHMLLLGALCSAASFLGIAMVNNTPASIVAWCVLQGVGNGLILSTVATVVVASVPAAQNGVANGMNNNIRTLGGSFGAAVTATILGPTAPGAPSANEASWPPSS